MGVLTELGFGPEIARTMLIDPPDYVLAEASTLKPRPSIASSVMTAEPASLVAWWPDRARLDQSAVSRLHWMVSNASGEAWLVFDPDDEDLVTAGEIRAAAEQSQFEPGEELTLSSGEVALHLRLANTATP